MKELSLHRYINSLELLIKKGCRIAGPGEFSMRSFKNGKIDLSQAESITDLIASESKLEHKTALHQLRGGFKKELELVGVGYRASNSGQNLEMALGFSHNVVFEIPAEVKIETKSEKGQNPIITLTSVDNQLLGAVAAKIRSLRKPEP